jgi:energy-coupling factor transporter ATP-binding protein EcfA2
MSIDDVVSAAPQLFRDFLEQRGLVYDPQTQLDLLACALSSQFLLFAGPSGTGKSTAAGVLADFLTPRDNQAVIDARPAWTSSEDVAGQFSAFANAYLPGPATDDLIRLANRGNHVPVLTVEEANLSPMEAYFGPVITAASRVAFETLPWQLHRQPFGTTLTTPPGVNIGGYPRIFATINIDSTAEAPAPKVSGRACVVLLEPPSIEQALGSTDAIVPPPIQPPSTPVGAELLGDPRNAWTAHLMTGPTGRFTDALAPFLKVLSDSAGQGANLVSPRDVQRCVLFMSWHVQLAEAALAAGLVSSATDAESAENAILHFVLPGLSSAQFGRAISPLVAAASPDGLLARRLKKLAIDGEGVFGLAPDFWASLS